MLFILAGFDTTANTLSFAIHLLAKHADCQETLRKELRERLRTAEDGRLSYNDIMEDNYLEAVLAGEWQDLCRTQIGGECDSQ